MGFAGFFIYKLCKKERGEDVDMDYSVAVTNSMFREERFDTFSISLYFTQDLLHFYLSF